MSATVVTKTENGERGATYDVDAAGIALSVEFYLGDAAAGEAEWRADVTFVSIERNLGGEGETRRVAFLAAASRHGDAVRRNIPLPEIHWSDVLRALEDAKAFL